MRACGPKRPISTHCRQLTFINFARLAIGCLDPSQSLSFRSRKRQASTASYRFYEFLIITLKELC